MRLLLLCFLFAALTIAATGQVAASDAFSARKFIKDNGISCCGSKGDVDLEDYKPVDPSPSSKKVQPAPINHGTPLIPYVPKPSPPPRAPHFN